MKRLCVVTASVVAAVVPVLGSAAVWFVEPRMWVPLALFGVFIVWCWWARVVDPVGAFVRPLLWFLLAGMVAWNPVLMGVSPWWLVPCLLVVFAVTWWRALARFGSMPRVWVSFGSGDAVDDEPEPVPVPPRVRDVTRTERAVHDFGDGVQVGYGHTQTFPDEGSRVRTVRAMSRYAGVVIGDPDDDDEDELSLLKQVADLFPDRRRSETGKVSVRDVADRLDMTVPEVTGRLAQDGVPVARLNGVTPLAGGGSASAMNAVRWVDISRAAEERGR